MEGKDQSLVLYTKQLDLMQNASLETILKLTLDYQVEYINCNFSVNRFI